jgi:hypothetical protein
MDGYPSLANTVFVAKSPTLFPMAKSDTPSTESEAPIASPNILSVDTISELNI